MNKKFTIVLLLTAALPVLVSCKKMTNEVSFCEAVNFKRAECVGRKHYCDQTIAVAKQDVINKVRNCPAEAPPDVYLISNPYQEMGEIPCCVSAIPASPQRK